jgi:hypothetical protein
MNEMIYPKKFQKRVFTLLYICIYILKYDYNFAIYRIFGSVLSVFKHTIFVQWLIMAAKLGKAIPYRVISLANGGGSWQENQRS